jgi:glycosyltransferase involved in cell wall biosynthesis
MRSLPKLLGERPNAHILIVGGDDVSYGPRPENGKKWKDIFIDEVRPQMRDTDWARVHFLGKVTYPHFISLLQLSTVHVYLTYPFVLSWSLLEAMSMGCAIVASDTAPLREVIVPGETGQLVDFFDTTHLAAEVAALLSDSHQRQQLGLRARQFAREHYDVTSICLPQQLAWVQDLAQR